MFHVNPKTSNLQAFQHVVYMGDMVYMKYLKERILKIAMKKDLYNYLDELKEISLGGVPQDRYCENRIPIETAAILMICERLDRITDKLEALEKLYSYANNDFRK